MKTLGTILPTARSIALNDAWHAQRETERANIGASHPMLTNCERRNVGGETRYHFTGNLYSVVPMNGKGLRFFETRKDGDYAITQKQLEEKL